VVVYLVKLVNRGYSMSEKKAIFFINILKNTINVYFDTFFVFYFFKVANYEVLPLAKYYLTLYLFIGIGFYLIRKSMKKNIRVPYFRIGISLQAIYIALIMLLKDKIIDYIFLVGIAKGLADGFYYFPKNIFVTEKINNDERQKYDGLLNIINKIISICVPLILGVALTYISYTNLGKVFFVLFIVMFIISFYLVDSVYNDKKFEIKKFFEIVKKNKNIKDSLIIYFMAGFTYSSGVMGTIITLSKINIFKTSLNLGFVDSICALVYLIVCILFTSKIKRENFKNTILTSSIISFITLMVFAFKPSIPVLIAYLIVRNSFIGLINLISNNVTTNLSNSKELKEEFKAEYFLCRDVIYSSSRCLGYLVLLVVCLTVGMNYINYILIISAVALLVEGILVAKLSKESVK